MSSIHDVGEGQGSRPKLQQLSRLPCARGSSGRGNQWNAEALDRRAKGCRFGLGLIHPGAGMAPFTEPRPGLPRIARTRRSRAIRLGRTGAKATGEPLKAIGRPSRMARQVSHILLALKGRACERSWDQHELGNSRKADLHLSGGAAQIACGMRLWTLLSLACLARGRFSIDFGGRKSVGSAGPQ